MSEDSFRKKFIQGWALQNLDEYWNAFESMTTKTLQQIEVQGDPSGQEKPPVDLDLICFANLPWQQVAAIVAH